MEDEGPGGSHGERGGYCRQGRRWTERAQHAGCTILDGAEEDYPGEFHSTGSFFEVAFLELRKTHT